MTSEFDIHANLLDEDIGTRQPVDGCVSDRFIFSKIRINGRLHFVKELRPEFMGDLALRDSLYKEFAIGYNLDHPGIVRYLRYEQIAVYEEYVDGANLRQLLDEDDKRLCNPETVSSITRQLLEALEYLHSAGVLHLDLKEENVMITRVGTRVKIVDLGCATSAQNDTTPGFTAAVKAPEQGIGPTQCATDIYLAGQIISRLADRCGEARRWHRFVSRATAENPADRFPTAADAIKALPRRHRREILISAFMLGAAAAGAAVALMFGRGMHQEAEVVPPPQIMLAPVPADTVVREITVPAPVPEPDPLDVLNRRLDDYVRAYYRKNVKPACLAVTDTSGRPEMQQAMEAAINHCLEYGRRLAAENPDYRSEIIEQTNVSVGNAQHMINAWLP